MVTPFLAISAPPSCVMYSWVLTRTGTARLTAPSWRKPCRRWVRRCPAGRSGRWWNPWTRTDPDCWTTRSSSRRCWGHNSNWMSHYTSYDRHIGLYMLSVEILVRRELAKLHEVVKRCDIWVGRNSLASYMPATRHISCYIQAHTCFAKSVLFTINE